MIVAASCKDHGTAKHCSLSVPAVARRDAKQAPSLRAVSAKFDHSHTKLHVELVGVDDPTIVP